MLPEKTGAAAEEESDRKDKVGRNDDARLRQRYSQTDHAVTCLGRVLGEFGLPFAKEEIHRHLSASLCRDDVINFLDVAEKFGLDGRPVVLTSAEWQNIPSSSILHWGSAHLVVFESHFGDLVIIHDPALGTRQVEMAEFRRQFTGVALLFEPAASPRD